MQHNASSGLENDVDPQVNEIGGGAAVVKPDPDLYDT
jgi:hypothetical protein